MSKTAVKIALWESEAGWGSKIDNYMVCLSPEDALEFKKEFNAKNDLDITPDFYMQVRDEPIAITLSDEQFAELSQTENKRMWWSALKKISPVKQ